MLVYKENLNVSDISVYHNIDNLAGKKITQVYLDLKSDIIIRGIIDPVVCIKYPDKLEIEIGEQRLLIAQELNIETLKAFVYEKNGGKIDFEYDVKINNIDDLETYIPNYEYVGDKTITEEIQQVKILKDVVMYVPGYKMLKKYIERGIVILD